jgi:hypothetical protein
VRPKLDSDVSPNAVSSPLDTQCIDTRSEKHGARHINARNHLWRGRN